MPAERHSLSLHIPFHALGNESYCLWGWDGILSDFSVKIIAFREGAESYEFSLSDVALTRSIVSEYHVGGSIFGKNQYQEIRGYLQLPNLIANILPFFRLLYLLVILYHAITIVQECC